MDTNFSYHRMPRRQNSNPRHISRVTLARPLKDALQTKLLRRGKEGQKVRSPPIGVSAKLAIRLFLVGVNQLSMKSEPQNKKNHSLRDNKN